MPTPRPLHLIEVEGFRSLERIVFEPRQLNVLIGPNGVGKSNFLDLFDFVGELTSGRLGVWTARHGGADRVLFGGLARSERLRVRMEFAGGRQAYEAVLEPSVTGGLFFANEQCWGQAAGYERPYRVHLGGGHSESELIREAAQFAGGVASWTVADLQGLRRYHFHDTSPTAAARQKPKVDDNRALRRDGGNLAAVLYRLQETDPQSFTRISDAVRFTTPFFGGFDLRPDPLDPTVVPLQWKHIDSDMFGDAAMLSDGTLRFMCLATVLLQPEPPPVILIDEPELGLHPAAIVNLAAMMRSVAHAPGGPQIIVSTQSVSLLDQLELDDVVVADRAHGATELKRPDPADLVGWLEDFSVGDLWNKNLLGGRPG